MTSMSSDSGVEYSGSIELAREIHSAWDQAWPTIEQSINDQADHTFSRADYFLAADKQQLKILERQQPLFHKMLGWFIRHPACSRDEFLTETYCLATTWQKDLGRLSLDRLG